MSYIAKPFAWLLLFLYNLVGNYGVAIILFALIVKVILLPFQMKSKRGMMHQARLSPRLKELEKKYEGNKEKYNQEVARIYKEEKISPLSGCLWTLLPFPILIALYSVVRQPLTQLMGLSADQITTVTNALTNLGVTLGNGGELEMARYINVYFDQIKALVPNVLQLDFSFIGLDLSLTPQWNFFMDLDWTSFATIWPALGLFLIPIISAVVSFLSTKISQSMSGAAPVEGNMKAMVWMSPIISLWIGYTLAAAIGLYWAVSGFFSIIQDMILTKYYKKKLDAEDEARSGERLAREAEIEAKRLETERLREQNATVRNPNTSKRKLQKTEKQQSVEKAGEWSKKDKDSEVEPARVDNRRFARGRAYSPERFGDDDGDDDESGELADDTDVRALTGAVLDEENEIIEVYEEDGDEDLDDEDVDDDE